MRGSLILSCLSQAHQPLNQKKSNIDTILAVDEIKPN